MKIGVGFSDADFCIVIIITYFAMLDIGVTPEICRFYGIIINMFFGTYSCDLQ